MGLNAVCVHAHFYQPPREDPLSGHIPDEKGAEPYRNWNERIHAECYRPNADLGNFAKISFNFGPTVLNWMEAFDPEVYRQIIHQERANYERFGVGNGMAQAYNHTILPLASRRDKETQIHWGILDFQHRFGHQPEGMWLPETAADLETLSILADHGIKFTMLAPWQVSSQEPLSGDEPYLITLPGNRPPMIVFLYNQPLSTAISFESEATRNADSFVDRMILPYYVSDNGNNDHFRLIASDGELYGHHKVFRDKFLAHMLNGALHKHQLAISFPGLWLRTHTPTRVVTLNESTSWSCHHGVVRWAEECACTAGALWKAPLRVGLERLAEEIDRQYQSFMEPLFEPMTRRMWQLRDDYLKVFLGDLTLTDLLSQYISPLPSVEMTEKIGKLLAAQYERQRIFTSCGWFFDRFNRIEPQNNIAYAAQAVWLTHQVTAVDLKPLALELLTKVKDQQTGLRGDTVFTERYQRMQDFSEDDISYFNPSSSFST